MRAVFAVLRVIWHGILAVWDILVTAILWAVSRPPIPQICSWATGPGYRGYRRGTRIILIALPIWAGLALVGYLANVFILHQPWLFSLIGILTGIPATITLLWAAPLATVIGAVLSVRDIRGIRTFVADIFNGTERRINRYLHAIAWILIGEVVFFTYHNLFPVWKNLAALPILFLAVIGLILLDRLQTPEERALRRGRSNRPFLTAVMTGIVVVCTGSFLFPQLAAALRNGLGGVDRFLTLPMVLPIVAWVLIFGPLTFWKRKDEKGMEIAAPTSWMKWLTIMAPILYAEYLGVRWALVDYDLPTMYWLFAAIVVGNLLLVGLGMMFKPDPERLGRRTLIGHSVVTVALTVLVIFVGYSTKPHYYRPYKVVQPSGVAVVISDVFICPVDYEEYRGDKAKYNVCTRHGKDLVPFTSLKPAVQDSLQAHPKNRDFPEVKVGLAQLTGKRGMTAEEWNKLLGGKP